MKIIIKAKDVRISYGHTPHTTGSGVHRDKRKRKQATRAGGTRAFLKGRY